MLALRYNFISTFDGVKRYESDLTDEQWATINSFIPKAKSGGRPRTTDIRRVTDAILYVVRTGCQWRQLPHDFPPWQTVYRYFADWQKRGVVRKIQRWLYFGYRFIVNGGPVGPSSLVIDSSSVKTAKAGGQRGYDGGKRVKGRKRHLVVDSQGILVDLAITPANQHDTKGGQKALGKAAKWLFKHFSDKIETVYADNGYAGLRFASWVRVNLGARMEVSGSLAAVKKRFVPVPKRWVVERTFAWLSDYRRLDKDHERRLAHSAAMIRWASIKLLLNRL